jgi:hypothetical protein
MKSRSEGCGFVRKMRVSANPRGSYLCLRVSRGPYGVQLIGAALSVWALLGAWRSTASPRPATLSALVRKKSTRALS